jgi:hypothetical protein
MKTFLIIVIILAVIGVVAWWIAKSPSPEPANNYNPSANNQIQQEDDTSAAINSDLQKIDVGSPESDFQSIDNELNNL